SAHTPPTRIARSTTITIANPLSTNAAHEGPPDSQRTKGRNSSSGPVEDRRNRRGSRVNDLIKAASATAVRNPASIHPYDAYPAARARKYVSATVASVAGNPSPAQIVIWPSRRHTGTSWRR